MAKATSTGMGTGTGKKAASPASAIKKTAAKAASAIADAAAAVTAAPAKKPATRARTTTKVGAPATSFAGSTLGTSGVVMTVSHDQIAQKAYEIWLAKGCPNGQDEQNWREAEATLRSGR